MHTNTHSFFKAMPFILVVHLVPMYIQIPLPSIHTIVISLSVITFRMRFCVSKPASFRHRNSDREPDTSTINPRNIELRSPTPNRMTLATNDHIYVGGVEYSLQESTRDLLLGTSRTQRSTLFTRLILVRS